MALVVDTSVIISVLINEGHKSEIIKLTKGEELIAPDSLYFEIGNAFSAMFKRGKINLKLAKRAMEYFTEIPLRLVEIDLERSLEIADKYKIYAYDAYFIDCAKRYRYEIISLDNGLLEIAKKEDIKVREVAR
jgi:predicted nucleic acid-binding protein